ncbi:hypothetical protein P8C59_003511 [Phyllachora maydis]|uniref:Uncharacterized protein n=1 Tax=Phyllachora maydis TaxID=1825666 RepID=A0AAD9MBI1_9PEZI|nr:hypothetical protein P8C59_003511 [Phyllachora maydis]
MTHRLTGKLRIILGEPAIECHQQPWRARKLALTSPIQFRHPVRAGVVRKGGDGVDRSRAVGLSAMLRG